MTDEEAPTPPGGQLRDEAADWFAILRGPEAKSRQAEFEAWLARGALHRSAYNRIAEVFSMGKGLKADAARATPIIPQPSRSLRRSGAILSAVVVTIAGGWLWVGPLFRGAPVICPPLSGPETMIVWTTKGTSNAIQEAQAGRDYRQAARS